MDGICQIPLVGLSQTLAPYDPWGGGKKGIYTNKSEMGSQVCPVWKSLTYSKLQEISPKNPEAI